MTTQYDNFNDLPFVYNGKVKKGSWDDKNNHIRYIEWLGNKLDYKTMEDWYNVKQNDFNINYGSGLLVSKYNGSPSLILKTIYPDYEWLEWKFGMSPMTIWKDFTNHKRYAEWLGKILEYKNIEDWYKITAKIIQKNNGYGILKKYKNSPSLFVKTIFPDYEWLEWKFGMSSMILWKDFTNHKRYAEWLGNKLEYKTMEDWYQITSYKIYDNYGNGLLCEYYKSSPSLFVKTIFLDYEWLEWKFGMSSMTLWKDFTNHKRYAEWLGNKLHYKTMEDWYNISLNKFYDNQGGGLIQIYYNTSPSLFVKTIFPDYEWLEWKFLVCPQNFWDDKNNHIRYAEWLGKKLGYKSMEDWYKVFIKDFHNNCCGGLLNKYKDSSILFLISVYPNYPWILSKFKKNYSRGQVEWLNYINIETPDIRHILNDTNGEFSISETKYHADGFSKSKNKIYEYNGDFWHGNPNIYNEYDINTITKTTFGELYQKTLKKQMDCEKLGYVYMSIWESEWIRAKIAVIKIQRNFRKKLF